MRANLKTVAIRRCAVPCVPSSRGTLITGYLLNYRILTRAAEGSELPAVPYPKLLGRMVLATIYLTLAPEELAVYSQVTDINQDE